jgi:3-oxoacyl-[acyl-carrier protein] reductase
MAAKVALVTGGGRGIGRAAALRLARDGFAVVVNSVQEQTGTAVAEEIKQLGGDAIAFPADVSSAAEVKAMFERTLAEFGRLDVLVTSAGVGERHRFTELNEEIWERTLAVNAKGTFLCILEAAKPMVEQKSGRIITVGSHYSLEGSEQNICYSASKFAIRGMTQSFAKQLGPYNITVNCVIPGYIWTDIWTSEPEAFQQEYKKYVLLTEKEGLPEYVASVISFLASPDAEYVTAATLQAGGGAPVF